MEHGWQDTMLPVCAVNSKIWSLPRWINISSISPWVKTVPPKPGFVIETQKKEAGFPSFSLKRCVRMKPDSQSEKMAVSGTFMFHNYLRMKFSSAGGSHARHEHLSLDSGLTCFFRQTANGTPDSGVERTVARQSWHGIVFPRDSLQNAPCVLDFTAISEESTKKPATTWHEKTDWSWSFQQISKYQIWMRVPEVKWLHCLGQHLWVLNLLQLQLAQVIFF